MSQLKTMIFTLMMLTVPLAGCTGDDGPVDVLGCTNTDANNYNEIIRYIKISNYIIQCN